MRQDNRVLVRRGARELTAEEAENVSGAHIKTTTPGADSDVASADLRYANPTR
jgi:hypothetical protein